MMLERRAFGFWLLCLVKIPLLSQKFSSWKPVTVTVGHCHYHGTQNRGHEACNASSPPTNPQTIRWLGVWQEYVPAARCMELSDEKS